MTWFDDVAKYAVNHLEEYANFFLNPDNLSNAGKSIFVNPCPFCGHQDCFGLTKGKNAAHCFSCNESGTLIQIVEKIEGETQGRKKLAEWTGMPYNYASYEPEVAAAKKKFKRSQDIYHHAIEFYRQRLWKNEGISDSEGTKKIPMHYLMKARSHEISMLKKYNIGLSGDYSSLYKELADKGFEEHEIKEASRDLIGIPEGYFVFPYYDLKGNVVRINCKMFVRTCKGKEKIGGGFHYDCDFKTFRMEKFMRSQHENIKKHTMNGNNFSRGEKDKVFFFSPTDLKKEKRKKLILVEGEDDVISVHEALEQLPDKYATRFAVAGIGGGAPDGMFYAEMLRTFDEVYEAFDNDDAGDNYREQLDTEMPDVRLKRIEFPKSFSDIDDFLKRNEEGAEEVINMFGELLEKAPVEKTNNYIVSRKPNSHVWTLLNRHIHIEYEIDSYNFNKKGFSGTLMLYKHGIPSEKKIGDIDSIKLAGEGINQLKIALADQINTYYHTAKWINNEPHRSFDELLDIFKMTKKKTEVTKQIAWYVFHSTAKEYEGKVREIQKRIKNETSVANILKEVNGYTNQEINQFDTFPKIQIAQSLFPRNGDGYMYFAKFVKDGEVPKRVPCLITNQKQEIRLDLLKKKDSQSLLLIDNKYELPVELETNISEVEDLSLQYKYVDHWMKDELSEFELAPSTIVREIEAFIRSTYVTSDDVIKVLALWIYSTYYYTLFRSGFPYLVFNGSKGSGKSTLDLIVQLLAFNPTFGVGFSEASLFRSIALFGGTFILDELENMVDSGKVNESGIATVIKAGYSDNGKIYRYDKDTDSTIGYSTFGPKVISNISGVEKVIADRCIFIETHAAPEEKLKGLENPYQYKTERRDEMYSITSRAAISALENFREVERIFKTDTRVDTGNARLTQIMQPLVTIAKLVGGDYEDHLMAFYQNEIKSMKEDMALDSLEGKISYIITSVAQEVNGKSNNPWILNKNHVYDQPVKFDEHNGIFELDSMHFKVFAEEIESEQNYPFKEIHSAIKNAVGKKLDVKKNRKPTRITIQDEGLLRQFENKKYPHGYKFTFKVNDFLPKGLASLDNKEKRQEQEEKSDELF